MPSRKGRVRKKKKKKEKKSTQMPVTKKLNKKRKKEQTTNAYGKERKTKPQMLTATKNGCPNQASKQLTPNERNKTAETTSKTQTVAYL